MALSWPNLPCALKAAIGIGKRTLDPSHQSAAPQGAQQGLPGPIARPGIGPGGRSRFVNHGRLKLGLAGLVGSSTRPFVASPGGGGRISTRASGRFHFPPTPDPIRVVAASETGHRKQDGADKRGCVGQQHQLKSMGFFVDPGAYPVHGRTPRNSPPVFGRI